MITKPLTSISTFALVLIALGLTVSSAHHHSKHLYRLSDKNSPAVKAMFSQKSDINDLKVISLFSEQTADLAEDQLNINSEEQFFAFIREKYEESKLEARREARTQIRKFKKKLDDWSNRYEAYTLQAKIFNVSLPQCDLNCSANCFDRLKLHSAGYIFRQCLQPLCQCYNPPIIPYFGQVTSQEQRLGILGSLSLDDDDDISFESVMQGLRLFETQQPGNIQVVNTTVTTTEYSWTVTNSDGKVVDLLMDQQNHFELQNASTTQEQIIYVEPRVVQEFQGANTNTIVKQVVKVEEPQRIILEPITITQTEHRVIVQDPQVIVLEPQVNQQVQTVTEQRHYILGEQVQVEPQIIQLEPIVKNVTVIEYKQPDVIVLDIPQQQQTITIQQQPEIINLDLDSILKQQTTTTTTIVEQPKVITLDISAPQPQPQTQVISLDISTPKPQPQVITLDIPAPKPQPQVISLDIQTPPPKITLDIPAPQEKIILDVPIIDNTKITNQSTTITTTTTTTSSTSHECDPCHKTVTIEQIRYKVQIPEGYNILRDCSFTCTTDCFNLKKDVPFYVLQQCVELKCNCILDAEIPQPSIEDCDNECANDCIDPMASLDEVFKCVRGCGCAPGSPQITSIMSESKSKETTGVAKSTFISTSDSKLTIDAINRLLQEGYLKQHSVGDLVFCPCLGFWVNRTTIQQMSSEFHKFLNCSAGSHYHIDVNPLQPKGHDHSSSQTTSSSQTQTVKEGDQTTTITTITTTTTAQSISDHDHDHDHDHDDTTIKIKIDTDDDFHDHDDQDFKIKIDHDDDTHSHDFDGSIKIKIDTDDHDHDHDHDGSIKIKIDGDDHDHDHDIKIKIDHDDDHDHDHDHGKIKIQHDWDDDDNEYDEFGNFFITIHETIHQQNIRTHESRIKSEEQQKVKVEEKVIQQESVIKQQQVIEQGKVEVVVTPAVLVPQINTTTVTTTTTTTSQQGATQDGGIQIIKTQIDENPRDDSFVIQKTTTTTTITNQTDVTGGDIGLTTSGISTGWVTQTTNLTIEPVIVVKNYTTITKIVTTTTDTGDVVSSDQSTTTVVTEQPQPSTTTVIERTIFPEEQNSFNIRIVPADEHVYNQIGGVDLMNVTVVNKTIIKEQIVEPGTTKIVIHNYTYDSASGVETLQKEVISSQQVSDQRSVDQQKESVSTSQTVSTTTSTNTANTVVPSVQIQTGSIGSQTQTTTTVIGQNVIQGQTTTREELLERKIDLLIHKLQEVSTKPICICSYPSNLAEAVGHELGCPAGHTEFQHDTLTSQSATTTAVTTTSASQQQKTLVEQLQDRLKAAEVQTSAQTITTTTTSGQQSQGGVTIVTTQPQAVTSVVTTTASEQQQPVTAQDKQVNFERVVNPDGSVKIIRTTTTTTTTTSDATQQQPQVSVISESGSFGSMAYHFKSISEIQQQSASTLGLTIISSQTSSTSSSSSSSSSGKSKKALIITTTKVEAEESDDDDDGQAQPQLQILPNGQIQVVEDQPEAAPVEVKTDYIYVKRTTLREHDPIIQQTREKRFEKSDFSDAEITRMSASFHGQLSILNQAQMFMVSETTKEEAKISLAGKMDKKIQKAIKKQRKQYLDVNNLCNFTCLNSCYKNTLETNQTIIYSDCTLQCQCTLVSVQTNSIQSLYNQPLAQYSKNNYAIPVNYSFMDDCDFDCATNCADFSKGEMPWQVVDSCFRGKCNCHHEYAPAPTLPANNTHIALFDFETQQCDRLCAYTNCIRQAPALGDSVQCLRQCGCQFSIQQQREQMQLASQSTVSLINSYNSFQGQSCRKDYCSYFSKYRDDQEIDAQRIIALLKSKAMIAIQEIESRRGQKTTCNMTCVETCFNSNSQMAAHMVLMQCIEKQCSCDQQTLLQKYDKFLSDNNGAVALLSLDGLDDDDHDDHDDDHHHDGAVAVLSQSGQISEPQAIKAKALFKVDFFQQSSDMCCLDFEWEFRTGLDEHEVEVQKQESTLYNTCDLSCQRDCFAVSENVTFPVLKSCVYNKCGCNYEKEVIPDIYCDDQCRDKCMASGNSGAEIFKCVAQCGCNMKQEQAVALFGAIDGESMSQFQRIVYWVAMCIIFAFIGWVAQESLTCVSDGKKKKRQSVYAQKEFVEDNAAHYQRLND